MSLRIRQLAAGTVTTLNNATKTQDLGSAVAAGKAQIVKNVRLVNASGVALTVNLILNVGSTNDRQVSPLNISLAPGAMYVDNDEITLEATHKLKVTIAQTASAITDALHYVVSGVERDQT